MANIICSKSGLSFNVQHMPFAMPAGYYDHPLFHTTQHKLLSLAGRWAAHKLTSEESYLLYLALLDSTDLIQWRCPAIYWNRTDGIISRSMESLIQMIGKINMIKHPSFVLPSFVISKETRTLENSPYWIQAWESNYNDWRTGLREDRMRAKLMEREAALERLIKSSASVDSYSKSLASWAATAGDFPTWETIHPVTHRMVPIKTYWIQIITTIADEDQLQRYPRKDIVELLEHCELNIPIGSIFSHTLFKYLREGLESYDDYLGLSGLTTEFTILPPTASTNVYDINRAMTAQAVPESEPIKSKYPSVGAWLKDYTKWKLAQALEKKRNFKIASAGNNNE